MNASELLYFTAFVLSICVILAIDLGLFNRHDHVVSAKEATIWTTIWVALAVGFYFLLLYKGQNLHGIANDADLRAAVIKYKQDVVFSGDFEGDVSRYRYALSLEYLTGYLIEEALSVDNIFVIILILGAFGVEKRFYHRVLFWGIIGALVFRCIFIFAGSALVAKFEWILYLFAGFLLYTGVKMFLTRNDKEEIDTENHAVIRFASRYFSVHPNFVGNKFFVRLNKKSFITPLFLVLLIIEFSDVIFAVDSIPAIFSVTKDPYIIFFSNIFAVLGLRSMFFLLINFIDKFRYFKHGLSALLIFISLKMLAHSFLEQIGFTILHSLAVIILIIAISIVVSLLFPVEKRGAALEGNAE